MNLEPPEGDIAQVASSVVLARECALVANALGLFEERDPRYDWLYHTVDGNPGRPWIRGSMPEPLGMAAYGQAGGAALRILDAAERARRVGASMYLSRGSLRRATSARDRRRTGRAARSGRPGP